jgi:uncharacterized membrane protein
MLRRASTSRGIFVPQGFFELIAASFALIGSHAAMSAPSIRPRLVDSLGRSGFYVVYALVSLLTLGVFIWAYGAAESGPDLYQPLGVGRWIAVFLMPVAVFLVIGRLTTPYGTPTAPRPPYGIYRICRFPGTIGLLLWVVLHLLNLGDARRALFYLAMGAICVVALVKNQRLRRSVADSHLESTSIVPFAAILKGRQQFVWREIGWGRVALTLVVYLGFLIGHVYVVGHDPLAG